MKHLLLTTIAAVVLVGCGPSEADRALLKAAEKGYIEAVKQAIADGADVDAKEMVSWKLLEPTAATAGWTPLNWATLNGHKEVVELLIAKGADVNAKDEYGYTPLDSAIERKHPETIALLRKHGGKTKRELEAEGK